AIPPALGETVQGTLGGAVVAAGQLPGQLGAALLVSVHEAFVLGLQVNALIGAVVMLGLVVLAAALLRNVDMDGGTEQRPNPEPDGAIAGSVRVEYVYVPAAAPEK